ncbi:MAG TPA: DUF503 domain-containing protein [Candidatus Aminicenantes bacterium]|nr:DUF503 domain-containing protein [Candidatus Aminicenantes bacterium]
MIVGIMVLDLYSGNTHNLKEKRRLVLSLKERLRRRFNVAAIESAYQDSWQRAQISMVTLSMSRQVLDQLLSRIENFVAETYPMFVVTVEREFF